MPPGSRLGAFEIALGSAGILHRAKCDYETAAQYFQQELATWRLSGDAWMIAALAADAAEAELQRGNVETARALTHGVLQTADPTMHRRSHGTWRFSPARSPRPDAGSPRHGCGGRPGVLYERIGLTTPRYWVTAYERALSAARAAVGDEEAFTAAWQEGRRMKSAAAMACPTEAQRALNDG